MEMYNEEYEDDEAPEENRKSRRLETKNLTAAEKIKRARLRKANELDLSSMHLTELPVSIGELTGLFSLDISSNNLTVIPEWLGQLSQLVSVNISNNQLTDLPESFFQLARLSSLDLSNNEFTILPKDFFQLTQLNFLRLCRNKLTELPEAFGQFMNLKHLDVSYNQLMTLPESLGQCTQLQKLHAANNQLKKLPDFWGKFAKLHSLDLSNNKLETLPTSFGLLDILWYSYLGLKNNPFNPELNAALGEGWESLQRYLQAKVTAESALYEAKLILIGEGEVGKTCLMDALLGNQWREHDTTHGIEIKQVKVNDPDSDREITLNGWDFGGQKIYRPTHQLFFSAPAVYLVVWKPREGSQAGQVKEWIQLIKRREPAAKIIIVATHGGPQQRQPDIDRQELWDLFSRETVVDFFFVDSKPDKHGERKGIDELKRAIARVAASLPEVGRLVPKSFADVRQAFQEKGLPYLPLQEVLAICRTYNMDDEIAKLFITISHRLGHLTHYENDPTLRDIVILRPDWLATAMSYMLDDEETRAKHGLVNFSRLSHLWNDPARPTESRYPKVLHRIFLRLMERFDLSYRVADPYSKNNADPLSLIGQLVPDIRPANITVVWEASPLTGDIQQTQICRIVDASNGHSANAEGLFYQLIVRLHKYSLGRTDYKDSVHWQRGLVLEDEYKSRALLEHIGNDVRITVRSPFPEGLLGMLTREVKYLVESFWEGLRCDVMVPCIEPCGKHTPGTGMFEVQKLMTSKRKGKDEFPCSVCGEWQSIDTLLRNAPAAQPDVTAIIFAEFAEVKAQIESVRQQAVFNTNQIHITGNVAQSNIIIGNENQVDNSINVSSIGQFDSLDSRTRRILSQVDKTYTDLLQILTDEAKEGPRLFSFFPVDRNNFNPKEWTRAKFRFVLWCEHSRLPLTVLNGVDSTKGIYDLDLDREWFKKASPYLKLVMGTLGMILPIASSSIKLALDETAYKLIEEQLDLGQSFIDATIGETAKIGDFLGTADSTLRELHALLKAKDPGFGGLVRVMNKRQEFLWVHERFASEY